MKQGDKKLLRVTIAMPNRDDFKCETVASLMRTITQTGALCNLTMPQTCYIDEARNTCWNDAKAFDSDWLLFMDSDNTVDYAGNAFQEMIALGKDVVSGIYVQKFYPFRPLVYKFTENGLIQNLVNIPAEPFRADATGCGLLLISRKVLDAFTPEVIRKYGRPFDFLNYGKPNMLREDPAFCWRIKQLGLELWFHPSITMGHMAKHKVTLEHFRNAQKQVEESQKSSDGNPEGWMTEKELQWLSVNSADMQSIVEVGAWKGRSTKAFCETGAMVYAVDHWKGSDDIREYAEAHDVEKEFDANVGHFLNLMKVKLPSLEAAKKFNGNGSGLPDQVDMVFIDAAHDYENCKADILAWLPKVTRRICGHDYSDSWPGVKRAVNEIFGDHVKTAADSIWYVDNVEV